MKPAYCLNCEQTCQVEDWMPEPCICHDCAGPDRTKPGAYVAPEWAVYHERDWTPERQRAFDVTFWANARHRGRPVAEWAEPGAVTTFID